MTVAYWTYRRTPAHQQFRESRDLLLRLDTDHDAAHRHYRWPRPSSFNWALEWFDVLADGNQRPALQLLQADGTTTSISYARMSARSDTIACWLRQHGIQRGDRVLVALGVQPELWETLLACLKIQAVVIPAHVDLTEAEACYRLWRGGVQHIICRAALTDLFNQPVPGARIAVSGSAPGWADYPSTSAPEQPYLPERPTPSTDVAFGYFTSGTTQDPKLVAHTHASYPIGHLSSLYWNGLRPGDRHLNLAAPGWAKHSWSSLFVPWTGEATIVAAPDPPPAAAHLPEILTNHRVTSFCAPPSTWQGLRPYLHTARPTALRTATSAGEPLDDDLAATVEREWRVRLRDGYGQTETTCLVGTTIGMGRRPGWLGKPMPGYTLTLRDPDTGAPGDRGELCVDLDDAPLGVMAGYLDDPERTRRAVGGSYYQTGDLGERAPDGWLRIVGRRNDVFKSFDHRIAPREIEAVLVRHDAVQEVAVVPRPHPVGGAVPHAVVVVEAGHTPGPPLQQVLLDHAAQHLHPALRPRSIDFTARLPRTRSGKIHRAELADSLPDA